MAIPKYIQENKLGKERLAGSAADIYSKYETSTDKDPEAVDIGGKYGFMKLRDKGTDLDQEDYFRNKFLERASKGEYLGWNDNTKEVTPFFIPEMDFNNPQLNKEGLKPIRDYEDYVNINKIAQRSATGALQRKQTEKQFQQNVAQYWNTNSDQFRKEIGDELKDQSGVVRNLKSIGSIGELRGNQVALNIVRNNIARSIGSEKGVMTDRDFVRVAPGSLKESVAKAWNWVTSDVGDVVSEPERKALAELMDTATFNTAISRSIRAGDLIQTRESQLGQSMPKPQIDAYKKQFGNWEQAQELDQINTRLRELSKITDPNQIQATQSEFNSLLIDYNAKKKLFMRGIH